MRSQSRTNALLIELLIVILFFMLASTILVRVFGEAYRQSETAGVSVEALAGVQNLADRIYAAGEPEELLLAEGFTEDAAEEGETGTAYVKEYERYSVRVSLSAEPSGDGILRKGKVEAYYRGALLISLPCTGYREAGQ